MTTVGGGYNYDFVEPPPERLLCKICRLPCREAQSVAKEIVCCKQCLVKITECYRDKTIYSKMKPSATPRVDRDVTALRIRCPNYQGGCGWNGEIAHVEDHLRQCEISCPKCKQVVQSSTMRSHLDAECPCYCPYCDLTAEREVINSEHKGRCCSLIFPNNNVPQDKFGRANNANKLRGGIINEMLNAGILVELQKEVAAIRVAQSVQIAKDCSDKPNGATLFAQLYHIRVHLTVAVLIVAIIIGVLQLQISRMEGKLQVTLQNNNHERTQNMHQQITLLYKVLSQTQVQISGTEDKLKVKLQDNNHQHTQSINELHQQITLLHKVLNQTQVQISGMEDKLQVKLQDNNHEHTQSINKLHQQITLLQNALNQTQFQISMQDKLLLYNNHKQTQSIIHHQITPLQKVLNQIAAYQQYHYQLTNSMWSTKLWLSSEISNGVAPVIVRMSNFIMKVTNKEEWYSNPFFAFNGGYQMCLSVNAAGNGDGEGTHVSVYLHLMKGPYDDKIEQSGHWPLRGTFTIELLNQLNDSDHYSGMVQFHHYLCDECTDRVLKGVMAKIWGHSQFISRDTLFRHNNSYHKSDYLILRASYEDVEPPYQVTPVSFRVTKFSLWLKNNKSWYSSPFFAFDGGYQMCLSVNATSDSEGTHVSVFLHLLKGPYDDKLEQSGHWPLRGTFTIELLNQLNDSDHYSRMVQFHHYLCAWYDNEEFCKGINRSLEKGIINNRHGIEDFISHDTLLDHISNGYYRNNSLIFRIFYEDVDPPNQVAPVSFKMTKVSQWFKNGMGNWHSTPFYAFEGGYKMYLAVGKYRYQDPVSVYDLSVWLRLLKGPYDDKLERSGHWPLRGTFTIELLNQLNDSNHYSRVIQFHHHQCYECTDRVLVGNLASRQWGGVKQHYISNKTLPYLYRYIKGYHINDSVIFRISYEDTEPPSQVAPVTFKFTHFFYWMKCQETWYSSAFFAFEEGYQLYLHVHAGADSYVGKCVSVYLHLIKGPYDDKLEQSGHWPLRGTFTIKLLNQLNDSNHYHFSIKPNSDRRVNRVVRHNEYVRIDFWPLIISHDILFQPNGYLEKDLLILQVSYIYHDEEVIR